MTYEDNGAHRPMRPGKTKRDKCSGAWDRTRRNKQQRAAENRSRALGGNKNKGGK